MGHSLSAGDSSAACRKSGASGKREEGGVGGAGSMAPGKVAARSEERKLFMGGMWEEEQCICV